jgi:hypothetical protein
MTTHYRSIYGIDLVLHGQVFPPGSIIPATVDPGQLAALALHGAVEPTTAPEPPPPVLPRVRSHKGGDT